MEQNSSETHESNDSETSTPPTPPTRRRTSRRVSAPAGEAPTVVETAETTAGSPSPKADAAQAEAAQVDATSADAEKPAAKSSARKATTRSATAKTTATKAGSSRASSAKTSAAKAKAEEAKAEEIKAQQADSSPDSAPGGEGTTESETATKPATARRTRAKAAASEAPSTDQGEPQTDEAAGAQRSAEVSVESGAVEPGASDAETAPKKRPSRSRKKVDESAKPAGDDAAQTSSTDASNESSASGKRTGVAKNGAEKNAADKNTAQKSNAEQSGAEGDDSSKAANTSDDAPRKRNTRGRGRGAGVGTSNSDAAGTDSAKVDEKDSRSDQASNAQESGAQTDDRQGDSRSGDGSQSGSGRGSSGNGQQSKGGDSQTRSSRTRQRERKRRQGDDLEPEITEDDVLLPVAGVLDVLDNYAFVRTTGYLPGTNDVYVSLGQVKKYGLRKGDAVIGAIRQPRDGEGGGRQKYNAIVKIDSINSNPVDENETRPDFADLTPLSPEEHLRLEGTAAKLGLRAVDLLAPIGKGQRGLISGPSRSGKSALLEQIAGAVGESQPEAHLMVVLIDERPEEVTRMQRSVSGEVIASTFERPVEDHVTIAELAVERAKRLTELGHDVVLLIDSVTSLIRAYNLLGPVATRQPAGLIDAAAFVPVKRLLGAARNIENGGSLTIIATAQSGTPADTVVLDELLGAVNHEVRLSGELAERRIFPAIDLTATETRQSEALVGDAASKAIDSLRRTLAPRGVEEAMETVLQQLRDTSSNVEFLTLAQRTYGRA